MGVLKRISVWTLIGAVLGAVVATVVGPGMVAWYNAPGSGTALCNCAEIIRSTADSLVHAQLIGAGAGAAVFLILSIVLSVRGRKKSPPAELSASAPTAPPV